MRKLVIAYGPEERVVVMVWQGSGWYNWFHTGDPVPINFVYPENWPKYPGSSIPHFFKTIDDAVGASERILQFDLPS